MPSIEELAEEVRRCRDRLHSLEARVWGAELVIQRVTDGLTRATDILDRLVPQVEQLSTAEKVEAAVTEALNKRGSVIPLGWFGKFVAGVSLVVLIASGIRGLIGV